MKILILYPNLPMMYTPAPSVAIFTSILKEMQCDVQLFETTLYAEHENQGMIYKTKLDFISSLELIEFFERTSL